jgi:chloride channel protein, CIC family
MGKQIGYKWYEKFIVGVQDRISEKNFIIFSAVLVGLTSALAAIVLKALVFFIHHFLSSHYQEIFKVLFYILFPIIGILITVWIEQKFFEGKFLRGTSNILFSILKRSGNISSDQMYSHLITSSITVGFGGSVGLESPIVSTGAAIGSNYSRKYKLSFKDRNLILASGASAGIAAAFNAPIAGVLFALEVLLAQATISAFIPLIISAASGALLSKILIGEDILLFFQLKQPFVYQNVPFYIVLGICAGLLSVYYCRSFLWVEKTMKSISQNIYKKAIVGCLMLALFIFVLPPLYGEGYESIKQLANLKPQQLFVFSSFSSSISNKWILIFLVFVTMMLKSFAASVTLASGGNGGNFAPSLFVGAYLGYIVAFIINTSGISAVPYSNFTLVGMAGILSGIFHSPLTAIFLIAEITGGYDLIIPLMLVSAISFTVSKYLQPLNIDAIKLQEKGTFISQGKDGQILSTLRTYKLIETDFLVLTPNCNLGKMVELISKTKRNIFPVVDEKNVLVGVVLLDNIREFIFKTEMYSSLLAKDIMTNPPDTINSQEEMELVMKKFDETGAWTLPVLENNKYMGFISKSSLLSQYRQILKKEEE